jgi:hypothetical protein
MTGRASRQVFVERQTYRRRRMMDAAHLLPLFGAALLMVPLLWPQPAPDAVGAGGGVPMSAAIAYVFGVWAGLIGLSVLFGLFARHLTRPDPRPGVRPGTRTDARPDPGKDPAPD